MIHKFASAGSDGKMYDLATENQGMGGDAYTVDMTSSDAQRQADVPPPQVRVFINYRHDDTHGEARLLYERLRRRFGSENVFLDMNTLQPGMNWQDEIKSHSGSCHVFLTLIGPRWISLMRAADKC